MEEVVIHAAERPRVVVVQLLGGGSKKAGMPDGQGIGGDGSGKKMGESPRQRLTVDGVLRAVSLLRD